MQGPKPTPGSHSSHFTPPTVESLALRASVPAWRRRRWEASPMTMHSAGSRCRLLGGHQKQRLTPGHPAWGRGYPPGTGEDGEAPAPQHEEAATLGGGKALYNLLKQERRSPNAFWLTEVNPKISFNALIKKKKKRQESCLYTEPISLIESAAQLEGQSGGMLPLARPSQASKPEPQAAEMGERVPTAATARSGKEGWQHRPRVPKEGTPRSQEV